MAIYKGDKEIVGLYKGPTEIVKRYKGSNLIYEAFKWLSYSYTNLYYDLVPTTISGKSIKNKAKVQKVYGNSVVENQLVRNGTFTDTSGWYTVSSGTITASDNVCHFVKTQTGRASFYRANSDYPGINASHKYLMVATIKTSVNANAYLECGNSLQSSQSLTANTWKTLQFIASPTSTSGFFNVLRIDNLGINDTADIKDVYMVDLTQMFPFDTPTTLTDKRVQAILNGDYIAYNTGSLKNVNMSEISSEPYNLFDGALEVGGIANDGSFNTDTRFVRSNFIKVTPGQGYSYETNFAASSTSWQRLIYEYDTNKNFIKLGTWASAGNVPFDTPLITTLSSGTHYVVILVYHAGDVMPSNPQICFHLTGTRTGYAPHQTFSPLSFVYQGNGVNTSKDSMEITDTSYVFTKKSAYCDFNTFEYVSADGVFRKQLTNATTNTHDHDFLHTKYNFVTLTTLANLVNGDITRANQWFYIKDTSTTTPSDLTGSMLYTLATPQVITIPKKRLGIVDLGSLNWSYQVTEQRFLCSELASLINKPKNTSTLGNVYIYKYTNMIWSGNAANTSLDNIICINANGNFIIRNKNYTNATDFKNAMSGVYLFYETANDTTDIDTQIGIEAGGSLNTDSDVLPDIDFMMKCK